MLPENDAGVSRRHALLEGDEEGSWSITDLKSRNGTYVNANRIERRQRLQNGDVITIGRTRIGMTIPQSQPTIQNPAGVDAPFNTLHPNLPRDLPTILPSQDPSVDLPPQPLSTPSVLPPEPFTASAPVHPVESIIQPAPIVAPPPAPAVQAASSVQGSVVSPTPGMVLAMEENFPVQEVLQPRAAPIPSLVPDRLQPARIEGVSASSEAQKFLSGQTQGAPLDMDAGVLLESLIQNVQCSHCGMRYADSLGRCPVCGRAPEPAGGTAQPLATAGDPEASRSIPTGTFEPVPGGAHSPAYGGQMFPPQTGSPLRPAGSSTGPLVVASSSPPINDVRGGTTPLIPALANDFPILPLASVVASLLMLISLFMPWAEVQVLFASMGGSYVQLCQLALRAMNGSPGAVSGEPRALLIFLPSVATLVTLGSLGAWGKSLLQAALLLTGGALGLLSSGMVYYYLSSGALNFSGILGLGFKLFAFTSVVAVGIGLWKLISNTAKPAS
ncbi:MAG: FHA domain-containing protein [Armatimonadota bacterium]|nr:FHA domain-containing protein [Armatimonadota bacterium]